MRREQVEEYGDRLLKHFIDLGRRIEKRNRGNGKSGRDGNFSASATAF
jgi:hypothetical protein